LLSGQHEPSERCTTETEIGAGRSGAVHGSLWMAAIVDGTGVRLGAASLFVAE
jgi:hypothetical protein